LTGFPCNKKQINRKNKQTKFKNMYTSSIHGKYPRRLTPHNAPSHHLKYHLQPKAKVGRGGKLSMGGHQEKHSEQG